MVSIRIAGVEHKLDDVDEQWIREQLGRRMKEGQLVCVQVTINTDAMNMTLSTPTCAGGGGGRAPNATEAEVFALWARHKLNTSEFNAGQLNAFLKQVRRFA